MINLTIRKIRTSIFIGFILFSTGLFHAQVSFNNGLVGYFPFSGNTDDLSPININGVGNSITLSAGIEGNANTAYDFNGVNSLINYSIDNRGILDTLSVSVWIKTTSTNSYEWILGKYDWTVDRGFALAVSANNTVSFNGRDNGGQYISNQSTTIVTDGNWHHVVGLIYGNNWELWVDCNLEGSSTSNTSNPNLTNNEPLTIGNYYMGDNGNNLHFDGSIDEVRIYNRTLTAGERAVLCNNSLSTNELKIDARNLKVHPNPSEHFISISNLVAQEEYIIFNASGVEIGSGLVSSADKIDIQNLSKGVYFITLESGAVVKFVKSMGL